MQQVLGMMYGLALGDALGAPVEFWDLKGIRERYGPDGVQELPEPALFTDDTQDKTCGPSFNVGMKIFGG